MGNTHVKPRPRTRNKKQVHWKAADRPSPPGKPQLIPCNEKIPDLVTIQWSKPKSDGGSPITGYLVEHRRTGSPHWVRATPVLVLINELTLSGLEPGWRYQFRVSAENVVGISDPGEASEPFTVTLQRSAITAPLFTEELQDTVALENEKTEFVVHFLGQPPPSVCWFKDGFEIFSSRTTRIITEFDRSTLTIHQTALGDEGEIKCTATNRAGHASTKARLTIEAPPNIRLPRQYEEGLLFEMGEDIRLKISVAGRPTPLVIWTHNGESIQNSDRYEIENFDRSSVLKITDARRSDRGEYQIKAINKLGEDRTSFLVTVTDKPSAPGKARVVMTLGRSVTLSWSTPEDDGGCKIGNYIVEYYRLGWNVWLKAATSRQLTTMLGDLIEGSEYKFRVKAESPYGVSDPSEESEVVFIPDARRGITSPSIRSRSQPRDIFEEMDRFKRNTPQPAARKKPEPRSQSSTRAEISSTGFYIENSGIPVRPERTKIKSPPKTPEMSPFPRRKAMNSPTINKEIFDRTSLVRDMAYGSPELKAKKAAENVTQAAVTYKPTIEFSDSKDEIKPIRSRSPSPFLQRRRSPTPNKSRQSPNRSSPRRDKSPSPIRPQSVTKVVEKKEVIVSTEVRSAPGSSSPTSHPSTPSPRPLSPPPRLSSASPSRTRSPRSNNHDNFTGSSEFMLVLYPDENEKGLDSAYNRFNFDEDAVPPPLSLSAPELGAIMPEWENLKSFASSSELLHERAMQRFYESSLLEEAESEKRKQKGNEERKIGHDIPKIQINSRDDEDIVGLDRKHSLNRRLSAGVVKQKQLIMAQRRHSLKTFPDVSEVVENKLQRCPFTISDKRSLLMERQRSLSEEKEEEEFKKVRARMALENQSSLEKRQLAVVDEDKWKPEVNEEEYEESISEESTTSSEEELSENNGISHRSEEEEETYHPGIMIRSTTLQQFEEPFEILTKPHTPIPDPNFVPKPILKRKNYNSAQLKSETKSRNRSLSLTAPEELPVRQPEKEKSPSARQRSLSLTPRAQQASLPVHSLEDRGSLPSVPSKAISTAAQITNVTAAGVVIPQPLLNKRKADEEAKVVADHYGDIVKNYGQRNKSPIRIYTDRDSLKRAAEMQEENLRNRENKRDEVSSVIKRPLERPMVREKEELKTDDKKTHLEGHPSVEYKKERLVKQPSPELQIKKANDDTRPKFSSPIKQGSTEYRRQTTQGSRESTRSKSPVRFSKLKMNSRTPSRSPVRMDNWSNYNKRNRKYSRDSPTSSSGSNLALGKSTSPHRSRSPIPITNRKPKMKEITTQTSVGLLESFSSDSFSRSPTPRDWQIRHDELVAQTEVKVRRAIDYITDLGMFFVACWLYLFKNELLAIPVLLVMVYRQLSEAVRERLPKLPKWMVFRRKGKDNN